MTEKTIHKGVGTTDATQNEVEILNASGMKMVNVKIQDSGTKCEVFFGGNPLRKICIDNVFDKGFEINIEEHKPKEEKDHINPSHYKQYPVQAIEMMEAIWGTEATAMHCEMTAFKYRMRLGHKDATEQEQKKEQWYLDKAKELHEKSEKMNGIVKSQ